MQKQRNCGLPEFGGPDSKREAPVVFYGRTPLDPANPAGPYRTNHKLLECPKSYVTQDSHEVLELYALMKRLKALPDVGGILDQPAIIVDAINVIENELEDVHAASKAEAAEKAERDAKVG